MRLVVSVHPLGIARGYDRISLDLALTASAIGEGD